MEELEDVEFGRLARALIKYSMTGEPIALTGNERFYARRVMAQEDRFQKSYRETSERNGKNGEKGGRPKKSGENRNEPDETRANPEKPKKTEKNRNEPDETQKTDTDTDTEKLKTTTTRAREGEPDCVRYFLNRVNPVAPQRDLDDMGQFIQRFGAHGGDGNGMVIRACDMALSNRAANWSYIAKCLKDWLSRGIYTPEALDAHERDRRWKQEKNAGKPAAPTAPQKPNPDPDAWLKKNQWGPRPPGTI